MPAQTASPPFHRHVLHRLVYRLGQGALVYWTLLAMLAPASALPSRGEVLVSGIGVFLMQVMPRPQVPAERRRPKPRPGYRLSRPLAFLV